MTMSGRRTTQRIHNAESISNPGCSKNNLLPFHRTLAAAFGAENYVSVAKIENFNPWAAETLRH